MSDTEREIKNLREDLEFAREGWRNWERNAADGWAAQEAASKREDIAVARADLAEKRLAAVEAERDRLQGVINTIRAYIGTTTDCQCQGESCVYCDIRKMINRMEQPNV